MMKAPVVSIGYKTADCTKYYFQQLNMHCLWYSEETLLGGHSHVIDAFIGAYRIALRSLDVDRHTVNDLLSQIDHSLLKDTCS